MHPPPSPARTNFTLITECTPESSGCNSVYSVVCRTTVVMVANITWPAAIEKAPSGHVLKDGMGLPEYQNMSSLRDISHDGWLCTLLYNSRWKLRQLAAGKLLSGQPVRYQKGRRYCHVVHLIQNHTCRVSFLQSARRAAVLGQPSSLRPHFGHVRGDEENRYLLDAQ